MEKNINPKNINQNQQYTEENFSILKTNNDLLENLQSVSDANDAIKKVMKISERKDSVQIYPQDDTHINMYEESIGENYSSIVTKIFKEVNKIYEGIEKKYQTKIKHAIEELGKNVYVYGEKHVDKKKGSALIGIYQKQDHDKKFLCFETINRVNIADEKRAQAFEQFIKRLEMINTKNKESLKELHNTLQDTAQISEQGGAGLGLIELAKNAKSLDEEAIPFDYTYEIYKNSDGNPLAIVKIMYKLNISESKLFSHEQKAPTEQIILK